jgi:hypothetical protein
MLKYPNFVITHFGEPIENRSLVPDTCRLILLRKEAR